MDLSTAVRLNKSLDHIKKLVEKQGIPCDAEWTDYKSLNIALAYGMKDTAIFLLGQNCRVNRSKRMPIQDTTPLHNAVKLGDVQIIEELLKKKASVLAIDSERNTPLHLAFIAKQEIIVDLLLENIQQTSNFINLKNEYGVSHLHISCTRNNVQVIQSFLDAEANMEDVVDESSPYWAGFAAIHFAVNFRSLEALKILLKLDAKQIKIPTGETPLELAYRSIQDWLIMIDLLRDKIPDGESNKKLSNFHVACMNENQEVVENFIRHGANVDSSTPKDMPIYTSSSSLHCAVASRNKEKVELLLQQGASIDSINSSKMTPLHLALYNENFSCQETVDIVDILYETARNRGSSNQVDENGLSYFHVAITRNDVAKVKKYLDKGKVNVNEPLSSHARSFADYTPLHLAVWYQYPEMVRLLVENGADANASKAPGTPLHMAFEAGDIDFVELFLKNGARADLVVESERKTTLHLLVVHCFYEVKSRRGDLLTGKEREILLYIEHLARLGVDVNARDKQGNTVLHLVSPSREGCARYFQLLLDLGADVNLENSRGRLPFNVDESQIERYGSKEYALFYDHVQNLKVLGLTVHPKNEESCKKIFDNANFAVEDLVDKQRQRLEEISKLKNVKLDVVTTVYDFLKLDPTRAALFVQCKALKAIAEDAQVMNEYPSYGYLIRLQYRASNLVAEKLTHYDDGKVAVKRQRCD